LKRVVGTIAAPFRDEPSVKPRSALFVLVPLAILALPLVVFFLDGRSETVARNVAVAGVELGGLSEEDALLAVRAYEQQLVTSEAVFVVSGTKYRLDPGDVALEIDEEAIVAEAMAQRKDGGVLSRFGSWIESFTTPIVLEAHGSVDTDAINDHLAVWEVGAIPDPATNGAIVVVEGEIVVEYPRPGRAIDRRAATAIVEEVLFTLERVETDLPVVASTPELTDADLDAAADEVSEAISSPVILHSSTTGFRVTFEPDQLAAAIRVDYEHDPPRQELSFDQETLASILEPRRAEIEIQPVDAAYNVDVESHQITVVSGRKGTLMDLPGIAESLLVAALGSGTGGFPLVEGAEPDFTTQEAKSYLPMGLVAEFTTDMPGVNRVRNIQLMADAVDGARVMPGQIFSINDHVGERTLEKGYLEDCAIVANDLICEGHPANIGGGVSQFATTFYNAVFFGCYEDVEHRPHSLYFSRYPEGREATLGFPKPDVIFRNDSEHPVIIKTKYTNRQITVLFYGDNGGRECEADTSERRDIVEHEQVFVPDEPEDGETPLLPGQEEKLNDGKDGWLVVVTRIVTMPDGTVIREDPFPWRYAKLDEKIAVHPCMVSGEPVGCPVQLPSVVGQPWDDALVTLDALGYVVVQAAKEVEDETDDGIVLAMDPAAGTWADPGTSITLTVGTYPGGGGGAGAGGGGGEGGGEDD
jgi:vancomycin resistance protein YoaR